ncbi:hypothetical protein GCM10023315_14850 [Algibacter aquimarinus]|uniref:tRNA_anti-like n=2 Tax=Algibacter aquimarinus TaxID=1136748 RepID=A0ABP9HBS1_9FLAO
MCLTALIIFSSCYKDNSDQIVQRTTTTKQFKLAELLEALNLNNSNLKETVVEVQGVVEDVNYLNNRSTIILSEKGQTDVLAICDIQENQSLLLENLKQGQVIKIKGILKGSLKDVILLNCLITN